MLLPPCSAAGVAEGAWAGPDVQHFADQPLRTPQLPGLSLPDILVQSEPCRTCPEHCVDVTVLDVGQASKGQ